MNNYGINPAYQSPMRYSPSSNNISWVRGADEANAYQLFPNSNVLLMDSENEGIFYIKTRDTMGLSHLRTFKYEEVNPAEEKKTEVDLSNYVTKEELQKLLETVKEDRHEQSVQSIKSNNKSKSQFSKPGEE